MAAGFPSQQSRMTTYALKTLEGRTLEEICILHDQITLRFEGDIRLAILSRYLSNQPLENFINQTVTSANQTASSMCLSFGKGGEITVDLSPDAFSGPEAMLLEISPKQLIVWS